MFATSIVISLADIVESRFPVSSSHVLLCPDFKEAFEAGQETPTMLACIKLNEMFTDLLESNDTIVSRKEKLPQVWSVPSLFHSCDFQNRALLYLLLNYHSGN